MKEKETQTINVESLLAGDIVKYYNIDEHGEAYIETGTVKNNNIYNDGVEVYGEDWKQYVGKWFIQRVERNGIVIFDSEV